MYFIIGWLLWQAGAPFWMWSLFGAWLMFSLLNFFVNYGKNRKA